MAEFLKECYYRTKRPGLVQSWMKSTNAKYENDMKVMKDVGNASQSHSGLHKGIYADDV